MKQITIIGNLGSNAIRRTASDGKELMTFSVAVSRKDTDPIWFGIVCNLRENLLPYLIKGQQVCIVGDLQPAIYAGKLDLTINADRIELCGAKSDEQKQPTPAQSAPAPAPAQVAPEQPKVEVY